MALRNLLICLIAVVCAPAWAAEVALVMSVQGKVVKQEGAAPIPLEAYAKLNAGDRLTLEKKRAIARGLLRKRAP